MKNAMQLKPVIKNIAKDKHISAQLVMQNFMLERLLERISAELYIKRWLLDCSNGGIRYSCYNGYGCND